MSIESVNHEAYRLSSQQWALSDPQWQERPPVTALMVEGPADGVSVDAMRAMLAALSRQHEVLRTVYQVVPGLRHPLQKVADDMLPFWIGMQAASSTADMVEAVRAAIDMRRGPVLAVASSTTTAGRQRWAFAVPSLNLDSPSLQKLVQTALDGCLSGKASAFNADEVLQYPDYVAWQAELFQSEFGSEGRSFWQARAAERAWTRLPFEGDVKAGIEGRAVGSHCQDIDADVIVKIGALARRLDVSSEAVLMGLWAGFVSRITQGARVSFDWHCPARSDDLADAVGCFVNRLPVSLGIDHRWSVDELVRPVAMTVGEALVWQECFDASVLEGVRADEGAHAHRLAFSYARWPEAAPGWAFLRVDTDPGAAQLLCECIESGSRLMLCWTWGDAHDADTVKTWMGQFTALVRHLVSDLASQAQLGRASMLSEDERKRILGFASMPCKERRTETLHQLFEAQADRTPHEVAIACDGNRVTYAEMEARANRLARHLQSLGAGTEQVIGVHIGRSIHAIIAMLAVMKTGAAYAPLDPAYPAERITLMIQDAGIRLLIADEGDRERLAFHGAELVCIGDEAAESDAPFSARHKVMGGHLAYLIYTSGSTGRPKGVMVSHANAVASTSARASFYEARVSRFLLLSSFSFDSSVAGIFWTLAQGGTLHLPADGIHRDPQAIAGLIDREGISHLLTLPSFYKQILDTLPGGESLRCAIVAGEACHADVVEKHLGRLPASVLVNEYGPTEGTVWSNAFRVKEVPSSGQRVPIGGSVPSMRCHVLDEHLDLCPIGMPGELYIGGDGITRGYLGRPGLTAQRFVADPHMPGQRLYRTGDLARCRPDGGIEYLGRLDQQVKLRGHRIELGEIESSLLTHERVDEAVVLVQDDPDLGQRLVAYVVSDTSPAGTEALRRELDSHLRVLLPEYMVPSRFMVLSRLPFMPNGKVDRLALLALTDASQRPAYVEPDSEVAKVLAGIWEDVLKVEKVGLDDSFFDLGGHSLLATMVTARIRQSLAIEMPVRELFEVATLRDLAAKVECHLAQTRSEADLMADILDDLEGHQ